MSYSSVSSTFIPKTPIRLTVAPKAPVTISAASILRPTKHPRAPSPAMRNIAHRICGRILVTILPITSASYRMNTGFSTTPSCIVYTDTLEFRTRSALSMSPSSPIRTFSRISLPISK